MARVAINGLGRIGRAALKVVMDTPQLELVAVNDLGSAENFAYLIRYDTVYGRYDRPVCADGGDLVIDGQRIRYLSERDPAQLPWGELDVDLVFECTGFFTEHGGRRQAHHGRRGQGHHLRADEERGRADGRARRQQR